MSRGPLEALARSRSPAWWLVVIAWILVVVGMWDYRPETGLATDAQAYHLAAERIRQGGSPYDPPPPPGPHIVGIYPYYLYPPPFAAFLSLFPMDTSASYRLMLVLGALGIGAFSLGLGRLWRVDGRLIAGLLLAFPGSVGLVMTGNVHSLVDGAAVVALVLPPGVATLLLASATAVKVTPLWPLLVVAVRNATWPALLAAMLIWTAVTVAAQGVGPTVDACVTWLREVAPSLAQGQFIDGDSWLQWNLSPAFAPLQMLAPWPAGQELPAWSRVYLAAIQIGVPATILWRTRHLPWPDQAGWVMVGAAMAAPILRAGYLPILLLIPALLHRAAERSVEQPRAGLSGPHDPS